MSRASSNVALPQDHPPLKASATAIITSSFGGDSGGVSHDEVVPNISRSLETSGRKQATNPRESIYHDSASTAATLSLIQKILTPDKNIPLTPASNTNAIEQILPPLTSSNDVDIELYAILAIIIKDFVNTWYSKITPDHVFVEEIIHIVAHCSRALEERVRRVDVTALMLDELPALIENHYRTYRAAKLVADASPFNLELYHVYHTIRPHPALTPPPTNGDDESSTLQAENERAYCHLLIQGALAVLLPTEDLQNDPLRVLVGDIIADLILGQAVCGKVANAWFLHEAICKVIAATSNKSNHKVRTESSIEATSDTAANRLEKFGLLSSQSTSSPRHSSFNSQSRLLSALWSIIQQVHMLFLFLRNVSKEIQALGRRPKRQVCHAPSKSPSTSSPLRFDHAEQQKQYMQESKSRPVLAFGIFSTISTLLDLETCMPWLVSMLAFWQHLLLAWGGCYGRLDSKIDRLLYNALNTRLLQASLMADTLRSLRAALFPNNALGPPAPAPPSLEEREVLKRDTAELVLSIFPTTVARQYFATDNHDAVVDALQRSLLDPLDDQYLNKHLIFALIECVLVSLIPELATQPINDLLKERGVLIGDAMAMTDDMLPDSEPA